MTPRPPLLPGATLGVFGGGQLGRMFVTAARTLGYRTAVFDPDRDSPAGAIADLHLCADYPETASLTAFARDCDAVTTEFENVPAAALEHLQRTGVAVCPGIEPLCIAQNRITEKNFLRDAGIATTPFAEVHSAADLAGAFKRLAPPLILKSARFGYDGKGQATVADEREAAAAFKAMGGVACIAEQRADLACELSVILARSRGGECAVFPVAENRHRDGILHTTSVPASAPDALQDEARELAVRAAAAMDYCGVLAVEFFVTRDGALLANEFAPRPHNSGHYTMDACAVSQFEQQARMMCALPAGDTRLLTPVVMVNLLGDLWRDGAPPAWDALLSEPRARLHLYGKRTARQGRKMGHFCLLGDDLASLQQRASQIHRELSGGA